ncbi:MAG: bifunctional folylpolyglutamate synthase/dihydrofolate synthase, partial [candidate division KSB1 bacterium]|nr:bifunctional folylpolyglutamate synthase/dihydrofolate synthase [candidate division KSB1 bacterium]
ICKAAGYKTGLYTSPHLTDVRERIRLNGRMIEKRRFAQILARIRPVVEQYGATYFETLTAAALVYFAEEKAEIVCLEVGLGGRLDATNVVRPLVSVITSISLDHTEHLGSTPAQIAVEKAGIIKAGVPCVIGSLPQEAVQVVHNTCRERGAPFIVADQLIRSQILDMQPQRMTVRLESQKLSGIVTSRLVGRRQEDNLRIAAAVCGLLRQEPFLQKQLSAEAFRRGVASCRWPGRFEILRRHPLILVDVAHNLEAMQALKELLANFFSGRRIVLVIGLLADKDAASISRCLADAVQMVITVTPNSERALPAERLAEHFAGLSKDIFAAPNLKAGLERALDESDRNTVICITGSHYVVGEARRRIKSLTT